MSRLTARYAFLASLPLLLSLSCGLRSASVTDPLPAAQLAQVLQQSFESADASARDAVNKIIAETEKKEVAAAFTDVKALSALPNITKDQRITAIRAANTIGQQLQEAIQNGDAQAAETLHSHNASH
jgi:hypothetical protein